MKKQDLGSADETRLEADIRDSIAEALPDNIAQTVTPWRRSMSFVLFGMLMCSISLNLGWLSMVLPIAGTVLSFLGFRALRGENNYFRACFILTSLHAIIMLGLLSLGVTVFRLTDFYNYIRIFRLAVMFVLMVCLLRGVRGVQKSAGIKSHSGEVRIMILWYAFMCWFSSIEIENQFIMPYVLLISYIFIVHAFFKLSGELDEAGYTIRSSHISVPDKAVSLILCVVILSGIICGYIFGGSYPMNFEPAVSSESEQVKAVSERLTELGFPEDILSDIAPEDIMKCEGAAEVMCETHIGNMQNEKFAFNNTDEERTYDDSALEITFVCVKTEVQDPIEDIIYQVFCHFKWISPPKFYGTEAIRFMPFSSSGFMYPEYSEYTGRVIYENDEVTYSAPFYTIKCDGYVSYDGKLNTNYTMSASMVYADFSFPRDCEAPRGYITCGADKNVRDIHYLISELTYNHQRTWAQYPVKSASEMLRHRTTGRLNTAFTSLYSRRDFEMDPEE